MTYAFTPCTSAPSYSDLNYITCDYGFGGYNNALCIDRNTGSCLPNCVGWVHGRFISELTPAVGLDKAIEFERRLSTRDAENFFSYTADGFQRGQTPRLGAILCWSKGQAGVHSDGAGHVAICEQIFSDGSIIVSASNYGGTRWYRSKYSKGYYIGSKYTFQGFIYPPVDFVAYADDAVERNPLVDQIDIQLDNLNVRTGAGTNYTRLGYAQRGYHNVYETAENGGYTWFRVAENKWCAGVENVTYLPKKEYELYSVLFPMVSRGDKATLEQIAKDLDLKIEVEVL